MTREIEKREAKGTTRCNNGNEKKKKKINFAKMKIHPEDEASHDFSESNSPFEMEEVRKRERWNNIDEKGGGVITRCASA